MKLVIINQGVCWNSPFQSEIQVILRKNLLGIDDLVDYLDLIICKLMYVCVSVWALSVLSDHIFTHYLASVDNDDCHFTDRCYQRPISTLL